MFPLAHLWQLITQTVIQQHNMNTLAWLMSAKQCTEWRARFLKGFESLLYKKTDSFTRANAN